MEQLSKDTLKELYRATFKSDSGKVVLEHLAKQFRLM